MRRPLLPLLLIGLLFPPAIHAQDAPLTIEQVMADPDWIGSPVQRAWWGWDSRHVQYELQRDGSLIRDTFEQAIDAAPTSAPTAIADAARAGLDAADPVYDRQRQRMAFVRNGDIFVRDLRSGALTQLTRSEEPESQPQFGRDGGLIWRSGQAWYRWSPTDGIRQAAVPKAQKSPDAEPTADALREQQLRTVETLARDRARREAAREQLDARRLADPSRAPAPVYLGEDVEIDGSSLSPDGRWLLVVTQPKKADKGQAGKMPVYVTESGYEEFENVRTRVGRNPPTAQRLWLADLQQGSLRELALDPLPGIGNDPLAALRKQAGKDPLKGNRPVRIETDDDRSGPAIHWSADGDSAAVLIRAIDNKDRWIASVDLAAGKLQPRHRLHDPGWINWDFNSFGWMPDGRTLWLLSEESGWSQLYLQSGSGKPRALTAGKWEASSPQLSADGSAFLFLCNRASPGRYEVCRVGADGGNVEEITALDGGVEGFELSPDGTRLLVAHSRSYLPTQLSVVPLDGGPAHQLTDTRTPAFKARQWIEPEFVQVPSKHGAGSIAGKYYGPAQMESGKRYPIVMFVHGAGYLQNVHRRYPNYFREQMFHNLLVQKGYIVLDLDYRGSAGYGRDWRTAIYRNMGHPELEDYLDGLDWLAEHKQGDRDRAGIYGGSYGGFMTFMALFRSPGSFKAGAALRPVVDWTQYNHGYTSNILNTPELDPEAYKTSSPIEYADGLQDHLLIAHGMMDNNVFYRDSVVLTQKLIELHKDNWELASYPLERHGFMRADSWLDEYKRVLKLFEDNLK
ncbi:S9 family peptidase [Pseudoxanthomonas kalamensis DSM 18571]|uniref:S9 family peptidase n=1 Tax=Pseudoxanthomonas kalamensis TaxID=289483 RepID=UPI001390B6ED|nr:S9 family peptidase [Pseudoxanthomonas kalamensis]KAF1712463.1 S9 family peptidase [Pseudoxanthomonas kalamensis DSM 18571]